MSQNLEKQLRLSVILTIYKINKKCSFYPYFSEKIMEINMGKKILELYLKYDN